MRAINSPGRNHRGAEQVMRLLMLPIVIYAPAVLWLVVHPPKSAAPPVKRNNSPAITATITLDSTRSYRIENLGAPLNGTSHDFSPSVSPDGGILFFVSLRPGATGGTDLWMARRNAGGGNGFGAPHPLKGVNTDGNEGGVTIAGDRRRAIFTGCERKNSIGSCDLYEGELEGSAIVNIRNLGEINTSRWEAQPFITGDGRTLYFVSNRASSEDANSDIFVSTLGNDGLWGKPLRLDGAINSDAAEDSPCVTAGGNALLFASNRAGGSGGFDIYVSMRQSDGSWGAPRNLGAPVNTEADDRFISATPDGRTLYFASQRSDLRGLGALDLYVARVIPTR